jgi:gamma-glutamylcyclotransferase (GGCT)/AIG2-like uncharacterized protein YtfP
MKFRFFSFGSFSANHVHFPKIKQLITQERQAFVRGAVYRLRCGYPALIPEASGDLIAGRLLELEAPNSLWPILDQLLGYQPTQPQKSLFLRQTVNVQVGNFGLEKADTYCLNPKKRTSAHKKITGGDWQKDLLLHPPVTLRLADRQKDYIHKLSRSRGRDIVPIKLDLYRELTNLDLVVDKGRRLALTPLGKEAACFIEP